MRRCFLNDNRDNRRQFFFEQLFYRDNADVFAVFLAAPIGRGMPRSYSNLLILNKSHRLKYMYFVLLGGLDAVRPCNGEADAGAQMCLY